jgi:hypothetical protein
MRTRGQILVAVLWGLLVIPFAASPQTGTRDLYKVPDECYLRLPTRTDLQHRHALWLGKCHIGKASGYGVQIWEASVGINGPTKILMAFGHADGGVLSGDVFVESERGSKKGEVSWLPERAGSSWMIGKVVRREYSEDVFYAFFKKVEDVLKRLGTGYLPDSIHLLPSSINSYESLVSPSRRSMVEARREPAPAPRPAATPADTTPPQPPAQGTTSLSAGTVSASNQAVGQVFEMTVEKSMQNGEDYVYTLPLAGGDEQQIRRARNAAEKLLKSVKWPYMYNRTSRTTWAGPAHNSRNVYNCPNGHWLIVGETVSHTAKTWAAKCFPNLTMSVLREMERVCEETWNRYVRSGQWGTERACSALRILYVSSESMDERRMDRILSDTPEETIALIGALYRDGYFVEFNRGQDAWEKWAPAVVRECGGTRKPPQCKLNRDYE